MTDTPPIDPPDPDPDPTQEQQEAAPMADVPEVVTRKVMMTDTYVEVGGINLKCLCESVTLEPENKPIEVTTFCGVDEFPGPIKWHFKAKFVQAFGVGGTDDALTGALDAYDADGTLCVFKVRPLTGQPIGVDNPQFEGQMIPQPYTVFGGDAGQHSEVDLDWIMRGAPTRNVTPANGNGNGAA